MVLTVLDIMGACTSVVYDKGIGVGIIIGILILASIFFIIFLALAVRRNSHYEEFINAMKLEGKYIRFKKERGY